MTENSMTLPAWLEQHSGEDFLRTLRAPWRCRLSQRLQKPGDDRGDRYSSHVASRLKPQPDQS